MSKRTNKSHGLGKLEDLSHAAIEVKPVSVDWQAGDFDGNTPWESYEGTRCEKCGKIVALSCGEGSLAHNEYDVDCEGYLPLAEGPMMSFAYPLPNFPGDAREAAEKLADLPLAVVEFTSGPLEGLTALALTGGGMDLSWEICEGYIRLGYLPPIHFEIPGMAGRGKSEEDRAIIAAYLKSCKIVASSVERKAERARKLVES